MTKNLFIKYLQGQCREEEFEKVLLWIKEKSSNPEDTALIKDIWDEFGTAPETDDDKRRYTGILNRVHHQININKAPPIYLNA